MRRTPRCLVPALLCLTLAFVGCGPKEDTAARRAREGLEVRLLVDAVGSWGTPLVLCRPLLRWLLQR